MSELVHPQKAPQIARLIVVAIQEDGTADDVSVGQGGPAAEANRAARAAQAAVTADDNLPGARKARLFADRYFFAVNRGELLVVVASQEPKGTGQIGLEGVGLYGGQLFGRSVPIGAPLPAL